ncbi:MAG TPA: xanthine dehydrogenase family protein subunit M [Ktedonobacteraceae bacterium]|nr:xanthine dehydrogenase family protein subunit M [Ktedonobacteraceae bacterium]
MKPPRFQYCAPRILDEALSLLDQYREDCKVLAGGQSFVPLLNMRLAGPGYIVDINHLAELHYIETEQDYLAIGAIARQSQIERSILVREKHPLLVEVISHIGHIQIRNRGTVVGSIAHADPAAELPALLTCLDGSVLAQSIQGERVIPASEFFTGYLSTSLEPGEMLTEVRFPWIPPQAGWAFEEFARRSGDYALVGVIAVLTPAPDDTCQSANIAYLGVAGSPVRAHEVEQALLGTRVDEQAIEAAAILAREVVSKDMSDIHGTVAYRRELASELTRRVLKAAWVKRKPYIQSQRIEQAGQYEQENGEA